MESFMAMAKSLIIRGLVIYLISSFFRKPGASTPATPNTSGEPGQSVAPVTKIPAWNYFENGTIFDLFVYISDDYDNVNFTKSDSLIWFQDNLIYGDWYGGKNGDGTVTFRTQITPTQQLLNNGSMYIHTFVVKTGKTPDPSAGSNYAGKNLGRSTRLLNSKSFFSFLSIFKFNNLFFHRIQESKIR